ncbi:urease accessory protein UreE [Sphingobacterium sp. Lzh-3]|jgi:urease accessory protein|uniref:urease accessory protein UreE n=1 Tax=unclassified Sphingobacterium TaxID=2609468 RepID=UPI002952BEFA|nr:urease accessory protein UreE [Sphingobacterium sp. UGAL515B_05]WON95888.1 urease accessory protein UreE [Sphingobacterium sp. UGAL515B_05]
MLRRDSSSEIWIDFIPSFDNVKLGRDSDILDLSYYEVNKRVIQRKTRKGNTVRIQRDDSTALHSGQCIYHEGDLFIQVNILPCLCVLLDSQSLSVVGEFCFDVGNRHLPVYLKADGRLAVSYDGRLYQALKEKYNGSIALENTVLEPDEQITSILRPILG